MKNTCLQGFTLVEMSIVLLIIGTIVGTIMLTQNLILTSRLQTVITDANYYNTAAINFKQTYQTLPGDFTNATTLWGTDANGCTTGGGATGTCNGNGDGQIINPTGSPVASQQQEYFLFWQHLFLAGLISQNTSNQAGAGSGYDTIIGVNAPTGSIKGSGFSVFWVGTQSGNADFFDGFYGNAMFFGASHGLISGAVDYYYTRDGVLTPDQAQSIDTKIDDGAPGTGKVRTYKSSTTITPNCATTAVTTTAAYNLGTNNFCSLIFSMGL